MLKSFFNPKSVALIGATDRPGSVGVGICQNLLEGESEREIFFINPNKNKILGKKSYPKISSINKEIDLAVIAVPSKVVPKIVKECVDKKVEAVIIISAGFSETGEEGKQRQQKVADIFKKANIPLIGPNCLGVIRPNNKLNATFAPGTPNSGKVAFISQSGALVDSVIDKALLENYGFSTLVSYGNGADIRVNELLDFLKDDKETEAIALYLEGLNQGREFIKKAKKITPEKPIVVLKAGVSEQGREAVSSHTASLAGDPEVYSAAFRKAGIFQVETLRDLLGVSLAGAWQNRCKNGIGVITNGGACGVMTADWCSKLGLKLTPLTKKTIKKLEKSAVMNPAFSGRNPLDIIGDALADRYKLSMEALLEQKDINGLIVIQTLQIMTTPEENAKMIIEAQKKYPKKPILACFIGGKKTSRGVDLLRKNKIPTYGEPREAVVAMKSLIKNI